MSAPEGRPAESFPAYRSLEAWRGFAALWVVAAHSHVMSSLSFGGRSGPIRFRAPSISASSG